MCDSPAPTDSSTQSTSSALVGQIIEEASAPGSTDVQCCCATPDCPYRQHSLRAVKRSERDVRIAGELGHALLIRHENYVAESQADRKRMLAKMEELERDKADIEERNRATIDDNRKLLDHLETLNIAVQESETRTEDLEETLRSMEQEMTKMTALVAQTEKLQAQLLKYEEEQEILQMKQIKTKDDERAAIIRSQQAERTVLSLHLQIEEIEREASAERQRHDEALDRIDRRRAVESEMLSTERAMSGPVQAAQENQVISHFVKDILQDNANLQLGIVELRELLQASNDEVESLRRHKSVDQSPERTPIARKSPITNLGAELSAKELHVHHHYHAPSPTQSTANKPPRPQIHKRPRRKRAQYPLSSAPSTPRSSSPLIPSSPVSAAGFFSQPASSMPQARGGTKRWSVQTSSTGLTSGSSVPCSPFTDSIFDRGFGDMQLDSSRPTSPESLAMFSPRMPAIGTSLDAFSDGHNRSESTASKQSTDRAPGVLYSADDQTLPAPGPSRPLRNSKRSGSVLHTLDGAHDVIPEEHEDTDDHAIGGGEELSSTPTAFVDSPMSPFDLHSARSRRGSIVSISGMDIHTSSARPSTLFAGGRANARNFSAPVVPVTTTTSNVIIAPHRVLTTRSSSSNIATQTSLTASRNMLANLASESARTRPQVLQKKQSSGGLFESGKRMGGWVFGKWYGGSAAEEPPTSAGAENRRPASAAEVLNKASNGSTGPVKSTGAEPTLNKSEESASVPSAAVEELPTRSPPRPIISSKSIRPAETVPLSTTPATVTSTSVSASASTALSSRSPSNALTPMTTASLPFQALLPISNSTQSEKTIPKTPMRSISSQSPAVATSSTPAVIASIKAAPPKPVPTLKRQNTFKLRAPGINQSGPIWGFLGPEPPTPYKTQVDEGDVDVEELRRASGRKGSPP